MRSLGVAVGTHDFTFRDLSRYSGRGWATRRHVCDRSFLIRGIQMVKLKHPRRVGLPAIDTNLPLLGFLDEFSDNRPAGGGRSLGLLDVLLLIRLIMLSSVSRLASNTVGLPAVCPFCLESSKRLNNLTSAASPFVHRLNVGGQLPKIKSAWEAGILPLNYARTFPNFTRYRNRAAPPRQLFFGAALTGPHFSTPPGRCPPGRRPSPGAG
jgi:hypothetical protein